MSSSTPPFRSVHRILAAGRRAATVLPSRRRIGRQLRAAGFYVAILGPFTIVAALFSGVAAKYPTAFVGLIAANVAGIVLGREYGRT